MVRYSKHMLVHLLFGFSRNEMLLYQFRNLQKLLSFLYQPFDRALKHVMLSSRMDFCNSMFQIEFKAFNKIFNFIICLTWKFGDIYRLMKLQIFLPILTSKFIYSWRHDSCREISKAVNYYGRDTHPRVQNSRDNQLW